MSSSQSLGKFQIKNCERARGAPCEKRETLVFETRRNFWRILSWIEKRENSKAVRSCDRDVLHFVHAKIDPKGYNNSYLNSSKSSS